VFTIFGVYHFKLTTISSNCTRRQEIDQFPHSHDRIPWAGAYLRLRRQPAIDLDIECARTSRSCRETWACEPIPPDGGCRMPDAGSDESNASNHTLMAVVPKYKAHAR